jgi:hypothetical protein
MVSDMDIFVETQMTVKMSFLAYLISTLPGCNLLSCWTFWQEMQIALLISHLGW